MTQFICLFQTQKELEIARDWNGGDRKWIHADLAREKEKYLSRPTDDAGKVKCPFCSLGLFLF